MSASTDRRKLDQPGWMREPRKTWAHPQDPITFSFLVAPGREAEAKAWVDGL